MNKPHVVIKRRLIQEICNFETEVSPRQGDDRISTKSSLQKFLIIIIILTHFLPKQFQMSFIRTLGNSI